MPGTAVWKVVWKVLFFATCLGSPSVQAQESCANAYYYDCPDGGAPCTQNQDCWAYSGTDKACRNGQCAYQGYPGSKCMTSHVVKCGCTRDRPLKCGGVCTDIFNTNGNCGSCGKYCGAGEKCVFGWCYKPRDPCANVDCGSFSSCSGGTCYCTEGYISANGDGKNCYKPNPCANVNCGDYSSCSGGTCTCNTGYSSSSGDGKNCKPIDPCQGVACGDYSSCSGGRCTCNSGYTSSSGDGKNCKPIDRCQGINCGDFSTCSNGVCTCNFGYQSSSGDGKNCKVIPTSSDGPKPTTSSTSSSTTTKSPTIVASYAAEPLSAPSLSSGTNFVTIPTTAIAINIRSSSRGLSCSAESCTIDPSSNGQFSIVKSDKVASNFMLKKDDRCLVARQDGSTIVTVGAPCSTGSRRALFVRQNTVYYLFWTLLNSSSTIKVMSAHLDMTKGCLAVPSSGAAVPFDSCSSTAASSWEVSLLSSTEPTHRPLSIGAIVGIAIGGVAGLALIAFAIIYARKKRSPSTKSNSEEPDIVPDKVVSGPFAHDSIKTVLAMEKASTTLATDQSQGLTLYQKHGGLNGARFVNVQGFFKAARPFTAMQSDELDLRVGDEIYVEKAFSDGWILGTAVATGKIGLFPADVLNEAPLGNDDTNLAAPLRLVASLPNQPNVRNTIQMPTGPIVTTSGTSSSLGTTTAAMTIASSPMLSKLLVKSSDVAIDRDQRIGEGGFGVVYVGKLRGSTKCAVKQIKGDIDERTMQAFVQEVQTWEGLVQRNVLPLMAFCIEPPLFITDLIEGGNMRKFLGSQNWNQDMGRRFMADVAAGMAYLHASGILHGDLKSLNVLIDGSRAVITDFGLAKLRVEVSKSTSKTGNGLQGTPGFVAPEILAGKNLAPPADVYAFAMTFYEVVSCGKYPFEDLKNVAAILYKVAIERARPDRPDGVPDAVWMLIQRCWAHEASQRPTFDEVQVEMGNIIVRV